MKQNGLPTLRAVAARAGVSIAIVSRVANGRFDGMTAQTRARVETAIRELGYRPNRAARSLRTSRHHRIALLAVDTSPEFLADPFNTYIAAGLSNTLSDAGYGLLLQRLDPRHPNEALIERAQEADALALYLSGKPGERDAFFKRIAQLGLPLVVVQEPLAVRSDDVCVIRQDDRGGARWLGERIRARGARDVLTVVPQLDWPAIEERMIGLRETLGYDCRLEFLHVDETDLGSVTARLEVRLAGDLPDVVVGSNDLLAAQAIQVLRRRGIRVPQAIGVTGFNAFAVTGVVDPPLTTVRSPAYRLGTEAARLLLERLASGRFATGELLLPTEPVTGASL